MKKLFILLLLAITATANAQVDKMLGQWNTYDDKTGDKASCVEITQKGGSYSCIVLNLYEKDGSVMNPPYKKEFEGFVGSQLFVEMKADGDKLKGKVYDPENKKTYYGKITYDAKNDALVLRGSLDKAGLLGRSQTWKRKK